MWAESASKDGRGAPEGGEKSAAQPTCIGA